jgi:hypothetical protein
MLGECLVIVQGICCLVWEEKVTHQQGGLVWVHAQEGVVMLLHGTAK